jgi:hypothetical protein
MQVICSALKAAIAYMHACMQVICSALKDAIEFMHACRLYAVP